MGTELVDRHIRDELRQRITDELLAARDRMPLEPEDERQLATSLLQQAFADVAQRRMRAGMEPLTSGDEEQLTAVVLADAFGTGPLETHLADATVTDVIANGADVVHVVHADGRRQRVDPLASDDAELIELIRTLAREAGARFDTAGVETNFALPDGSRLFAAIGVTPRPVLVVRRHHLVELATLDDLLRVGMIDSRVADLLRAFVLARQNVIISGGTEAGKTTLCRALCHEIPVSEHVVTVEDTYELFLHRDHERHPLVTPMLARPANTEGAGEVGLAQLTRMALRASPDRVVVGEVRGGEVIPMLDAMTQGNDGSMGTVHASSSREAPTRLASYAVRTGQLRLEDALFIVATAVDFVVHVARNSAGERLVTSIREISPSGAEGLVLTTAELFAPDGSGRAMPTGVPISTERGEQLRQVGYAASGGWPA